MGWCGTSYLWEGRVRGHEALRLVSTYRISDQPQVFTAPASYCLRNLSPAGEEGRMPEAQRICVSL